MGNYRDLEVWRRAQGFAVRIDRETRRFARGHAAVADQLRRAALSIPTNLAEGACRGRDGDFTRYVVIAIGSAAEVDSLLTHAASLDALDANAAHELSADLTIIRKMLFRLRSSLQRTTAVSEALHDEAMDHRP